MFEPDAKARLYSGDFRRAVNGSDPLRVASATRTRACPSPDPLDRSMYVDARTYMIDDVLTKVDRMSMAVSLEAREPLLDHKLLEFAATGPVVAQAARTDAASTCCAGCWSSACRVRSSSGRSSGFEAPIGEWLRGPLAPMASELPARRPARAIAASSTTRKSPDSGHEHRSGQRDHRHRLWQLIMLELWFRAVRRYAGSGGHVARRRATGRSGPLTA